MKGAVLIDPGEPLELLDLELGTVAPNEVQVRVERASVCHTDLTVQQGKFPMPVPVVIGHEAAGVVEAVGDHVTRLKPGDRVIAFANPFCGHCPHCHRGDTFLCSGEATYRAPDGGHRVIINGEGVFSMAGVGAFSERVLAHENSLVPVPGELPFAEAALIGLRCLHRSWRGLEHGRRPGGGCGCRDRLRYRWTVRHPRRARGWRIANICGGPAAKQAADCASGWCDRPGRWGQSECLGRDSGIDVGRRGHCNRVHWQTRNHGDGRAGGWARRHRRAGWLHAAWRRTSNCRAPNFCTWGNGSLPASSDRPISSGTCPSTAL